MRTRAALVVVTTLALGAALPRPVRADAVVGNGTAASCTEVALNAALAAGGNVTFNCGANPVTIMVTSTKTIAGETSIDGGGLVTLSGALAGPSTGAGILLIQPGVSLAVANVTIANVTLSRGVGGAIYNAGTLTVTNSTFSGISVGLGGELNTAPDGGAIFNSGKLTVTKSTFSGNSVSVAGLPGDGAVSYQADGGAIFNSNTGTAKVENSTFTDNSATGIDEFNSGYGGAIYNAGTLTVASSMFYGNQTSGGLGAYADGGAIFNSGTLTVANSTYRANDPGLYNSSGGTATVTNSTLFGAGAIYNDSVTPVVLRNTIVADPSEYTLCSGPISDGGHNLDSGTSCGFTIAAGSFSNTAPLLDPVGLASNGGPTQTIALQAHSPAINAGDEVVCSAAPVNNLDQRGYVRPGGGATRCSIGAYEYNAGPPGCCQCPTSCAVPVDGSCGDCIGVFDATCEGGCVPHTPTPTKILTPTPTTPATNTVKPAATVTRTATRSATKVPTPTPTLTSPCGVGDCNGDGRVTVDEVLKGVNIALGNLPLNACPSFGCHNGLVTVDCLVKAVNNALNGCGGS